MPRENRKRGKKHKKSQDTEFAVIPTQPETTTEAATTEQPAWIVNSEPQDEKQITDAPFGYLDLDVKAYFRNVDSQIREWQGNRLEEGQVETDMNEEKRAFFMAALTEMQSKEKQLATDADCSIILERMLYSMDDFVRRVFLDSLTGSFEILARNRFASHVCQTLFATAKGTIVRELSGVTSEVPESDERGELRTLTQLVVDICEELLPNISTLVTDPFASHVVRSLLILLHPTLEESEVLQSTIRSKKSRTWKAKQGQMSSVFGYSEVKTDQAITYTAPPEFNQSAGQIIRAIREKLSESEVRAMAADKVACPTLKVILEVEADQSMSNETGSLMDRVTVGIISACLDGSAQNIQESDYLGTLMRDANASHVLETIVSRTPPEAFKILWSTYFEKNLPRLSVHPVANFVVAKAFDRLSEEQLLKASENLKPLSKRLLETGRMGVLRAAVDRASTLKLSNESIQEAICTAFDIAIPEDRKLAVPCILTMLPLSEYKEVSSKPFIPNSSNSRQSHQRVNEPPDPLEPKIQGSLLLQSLLRLPGPSNQFIIDSIFSLEIENRMKITRNPTSSRVFDSLLDSPSVPAKSKRQFVLDFIGHYHTLVDDKIGSRIGDRCWAFSDTYLKEKIARSLLSHEQDLAASFYGKFFARNLNLYLLQRRPNDWRDLQSSRAAQNSIKIDDPPKPTEPDLPNPVIANEAGSGRKGKRKNRPEDEIDALFNGALGKKVKKAALGHDTSQGETKSPKKGGESKVDKEMQQILGAIKDVSSEERSKRSSKKKQR